MRISDWSSDVCSSDLGAIDAALEAERRVIIFKRLNGAEYHTKPDGAPQAFLRALAVAMDKRVMRPGDRRARAEQDQRVEQRQAEGIDHLQPDRRPCATDDFGAGREQRGIEIRSEEHTSELQSLMRNSY